MKKLFTFLFVLLVTTITVQAQWSEDFETGVPAGWTVTGDFAHGDAAFHSSQYFNIADHTDFMGINSDAAGNGVTVTGDFTTTSIDLTSYTLPLLSFEAVFRDADLYGGDEVAIVSVSTDDGTTWTELSSLEGTGGVWSTYNIAMGDYAGETVLLNFYYHDGAQWNYGLMVDDIEISDFTTPTSVKLVSIDVSCTSATVGQMSEISGAFSNGGVNTITSLDINWSDGTDTYTETVTGLDIASFETGLFTHPVPVEVVNGSANFDFWISNPNGEADADDSDNMAMFSTNGITATQGRGIYVEEATGTWCTWCPRGAVWMDRMANCFGEHFVGVAVHNADPMVLTEFDNGLTSHPSFTGFPSVLVDRNNIIDPSQLEPPTISTIQTDPVALLSHGATYDANSGELIVTAKAELMEDIAQAGYRLNVILTEDGMSGLTSDWAQVNAYSGGGNGPMGGYEFLPSPVPASLMIYDHVGRALLSGYNGASGSLPDVMNTGEVHSHTMDAYTVPVEMVLENVHVITIMHDNTGSVVNAHITTFDEALANAVRPVVNNQLDVQVSPNPAQDMTNIRINLENSATVAVQAFNSIGQMVASQNYGTQVGDMVYPFNTSNLANGLYQLKIQVGNEIITKSVVVSK